MYALSSICSTVVCVCGVSTCTQVSKGSHSHAEVSDATWMRPLYHQSPSARAITRSITVHQLCAPYTVHYGPRPAHGEPAAGRLRLASLPRLAVGLIFMAAVAAPQPPAAGTLGFFVMLLRSVGISLGTPPYVTRPHFEARLSACILSTRDAPEIRMNPTGR